MNATLGIELTADTVRAVALNRWRRPTRQLVTEWDPERPADLVTRLRSEFQQVDRVALSVGLAFLHPKHVKLPPAPAPERRRMLVLSADRYFPVQNEELVISLVDEADFAFAAPLRLIESWIAAFETWAPVSVVEPAPVSLARALGRDSTGTYALPAAAGEHGLVEVANGALRSARRIWQPDDSVITTQPLPALAGVGGQFSCALGAARGTDDAIEQMLLPAARSTRIARSRVQRLAATAVAAAFALAAALWSLDSARERRLRRTSEAARAAAAEAQPALQLRDQLVGAQRAGEAAAEIGRRRSDPLVVLDALSRVLPAGAVVLNVHARGAEWQIDGTAQDAAAIVPLLDAEQRFDDVRFVSASSRFREGARTYETFSIAFRVRSSD